MTEPFAMPNFLDGSWRDLPFEFFKDGIEICTLYSGKPMLALLRYQPGAYVPRHTHPGLETVLVLEGSQTDERGTHGVGALVVNTIDSQHDVTSEEGCVVLIQWAEPVEFINDGASAQ